MHSFSRSGEGVWGPSYLKPPFLQRWEDLGEQVWCLCTWDPGVVRETDKGESTWQRARELAPAHGERAPAPRGGSDARGRNHGSHIDSPARVFVSDESSPCGTRKLALRSPVRADFALVSIDDVDRVVYEHA